MYIVVAEHCGSGIYKAGDPCTPAKLQVVEVLLQAVLVTRAQPHYHLRRLSLETLHPCPLPTEAIKNI